MAANTKVPQPPRVTEDIPLTRWFVDVWKRLVIARGTDTRLEALITLLVDKSVITLEEADVIRGLV